jgi:hypothetical protein
VAVALVVALVGPVAAAARAEVAGWGRPVRLTPDAAIGAFHRLRIVVLEVAASESWRLHPGRGLAIPRSTAGSILDARVAAPLLSGNACSLNTATGPVPAWDESAGAACCC